MDLISSSLVSEDTHESGSDDEYKHNDDSEVDNSDEFAVRGGDNIRSNSNLGLLALSLLIPLPACWNPDPHDKNEMMLTTQYV